MWLHHAVFKSLTPIAEFAITAEALKLRVDLKLPLTGRAQALRVHPEIGRQIARGWRSMILLPQSYVLAAGVPPPIA